jgi:5-(carboxyamino)imidazole ribonucleotide synthase
MVNILGSGTGDRLEGVGALLAQPGIQLHLYGKTHAALRRKMGHFTVVAPTVDEALAKAEFGRRLLSWSRSAPALELTAIG